MVTVIEASIPRDFDIVRDLFAEYSLWLCFRLFQEYRESVDPESMLRQNMETLAAFLPPRGLVLLGLSEGRPAGCTCIRTISIGIAELKRMYVRPNFRGKGIGTALGQAAIQRARQLGYSTLRLDSACFMSDAHHLYRSLGFADIAPYDGSDVPKEHQKDCVFMQLNLLPREGGGSLS
jgi:GNAT superfamily N-acetyltransferase